MHCRVCMAHKGYVGHDVMHKRWFSVHSVRLIEEEGVDMYCTSTRALDGPYGPLGVRRLDVFYRQWKFLEFEQS